MPRKLREEVADGVFHVFARGVDRRLIYLDDLDRERYLEMLGAEVERRSWRCLAYCLMDNHLHLLVETPKPNLGAGMQRLHGDFAQKVNKRHRRVGHLFQGRYGAVRITTDEHLWTVVPYIARNPVAGGLVGDAAAWRWSSHAATLAGAANPAWLDVSRVVELVGAGCRDGRRRYAELTEDPAVTAARLLDQRLTIAATVFAA